MILLLVIKKFGDGCIRTKRREFCLKICNNICGNKIVWEVQ